MTATGTVTRVIRHPTDHGSLYLTVIIDGRRYRYLQTGQPVPARGDTITLTGVPMIGYKHANVGAARVTIHGKGG